LFTLFAIGVLIGGGMAGFTIIISIFAPQSLKQNIKKLLLEVDAN